jgi:hypothetical protein
MTANALTQNSNLVPATILAALRIHAARGGCRGLELVHFQ